MKVEITKPGEEYMVCIYSDDEMLCREFFTSTKSAKDFADTFIFNYSCWNGEHHECH